MATSSRNPVIPGSGSTRARAAWKDDQNVTHQGDDRVPGTNLTREEAQERARLLTVDAYEIDLDLSGAQEGAPTGPSPPCASTPPMPVRRPSST